MKNRIYRESMIYRWGCYPKTPKRVRVRLHALHLPQPFLDLARCQLWVWPSKHAGCFSWENARSYCQNRGFTVNLVVLVSILRFYCQICGLAMNICRFTIHMCGFTKWCTIQKGWLSLLSKLALHTQQDCDLIKLNGWSVCCFPNIQLYASTENNVFALKGNLPIYSD